MATKSGNIQTVKAKENGTKIEVTLLGREHDNFRVYSFTKDSSMFDSFLSMVVAAQINRVPITLYFDGNRKIDQVKLRPDFTNAWDD